MGKACPTCKSEMQPVGAGRCPTCGQDSDAIRAIFAPLKTEGPLHASAPDGHKCADCTIDGEACPDCYSAWWKKRHPNVVFSESKEWLIWSNEHRAWWGPARCGYPDDVDVAGRYTLAEARAICHSRHWADGRTPPETMIHIDEIRK